MQPNMLNAAQILQCDLDETISTDFNYIFYS